VKATTHTEVYRPFEGELSPHPRRALVLARAAVRINFKRKLPALLLFVPLGIACIIMSFQVHFGFAAASGELFGDKAGDPRTLAMGAQIQAMLGGTVQNIFEFLQSSAGFVLIVMAWYGAGLICEDKRTGANLLYFSRPLSRFDYLLGKALSVAWYGALALIVPCLVICSVAVFSSPEWSFLTDEWDSILWVVAFGVLWVSTMALVVLTVSSLAGRRTHALVGAVGLVFGAGVVTKVLAKVLDENRTTIFDLFQNMERVGEWMLGVTLVRDRAVSPEASLAAIGVLWLVCLFVLTERVRKLEVVA
jgi:ABC-2 type transport system permease protein